jgi:hypothetical protein
MQTEERCEETVVSYIKVRYLEHFAKQNIKARECYEVYVHVSYALTKHLMANDSEYHDYDNDYRDDMMVKMESDDEED